MCITISTCIFQFCDTATFGRVAQIKVRRVNGDGSGTMSQYSTATGTSTSPTTATTTSTACICCGCSTGHGTMRDAAWITPASSARSTRTLRKLTEAASAVEMVEEEEVAKEGVGGVLVDVVIRMRNCDGPMGIPCAGVGEGVIEKDKGLRQ